MRDRSPHILDVIENSIRAEASVISVTIEADRARDLLTIRIEDNGTGLKVPPEVAADPFCTTKGGKRVGLGLALLKGAAERAQGTLRIGRSTLGGASVEAAMRLSHVDRSPMGNLAATMASVVVTNPGLDLRVHVGSDGVERSVRSLDVAGELPEAALKRIALGLGKPYSEVAGVVGFYSFFSTVPRGKHLVRVCLGTACAGAAGRGSRPASSGVSPARPGASASSYSATATRATPARSWTGASSKATRTASSRA